MMYTTTIRQKLRVRPMKLAALVTGGNLLVLAAALGFTEAWAASSTAEIVPTETYVEVIETKQGSPLGRMLFLVGILPVVAIAEWVGVVAYEYLLWVPRPVVEVGLSAVLFSLVGVVAMTLLEYIRTLGDRQRGRGESEG